MKARNKQRGLAKDPVAVHLFGDNLAQVEELMKETKKTRAETLRELVDDGICLRRTKSRGYAEIDAQLQDKLAAIVNNAVRPMQRQLDGLVKTVDALSHDFDMKTLDLTTIAERTNERNASISNRVERIGDRLSEVATDVKNNVFTSGVASDANKQLFESLAVIKNLGELSARNLIGIRVVVWLYLFEIMTPLVKTYANVETKKFGTIIEKHVQKLFTDDVLKELAYMQAGAVETYIEREVSSLYEQLRASTRPVVQTVHTSEPHAATKSAVRLFDYS